MQKCMEELSRLDLSEWEILLHYKIMCQAIYSLLVLIVLY